jgi:mannose-6-phosphate isomerase-like protein (cupin superfamily)
MIKKDSEKFVEFKKDLFKGGTGTFEIRNLLSADELSDKGRLYAHCILEVGASVGFHIHENETETYYIIRGKAEYNDNGNTKTVSAGDVTFTAAGEGHSIKNISSEPVELIALILNN